MLKSMTGYGQGSVTGDDFNVTVDLRSVNHRNLDIQWQAPHELAVLEIQLKKQVQAAISRGRVEMIINFTQTREVAYELNRPVIRGYLTALRVMREEFGLEGGVDFTTIVRLPALVRPADCISNIGEASAQGIVAALAQALAALVAMRTVEGHELQKELLARVGRVADHLSVIKAAASSIDKAYQEKLRKRLLEQTERIAADELRLAQEIAYLADRSHPTEQVVRLKDYLAQIRALLTTGGAVGKRIEFLLQEMTRAINVIFAQLAEVAGYNLATEIKTEIEKIREQVLNVE